MNATATVEQNLEATEIKESKAIAFIHSILDDYPLNPCEFRLYTRIARRGNCYESIPNMAKSCGMSESVARRALNVLKKCGLIDSINRVGDSAVHWCKKASEWIDSKKVEAVRKSLTRSKNATRIKSDASSTPVKSDTGVVAEITRGGVTSDTGVVADLIHKGNPFKLIPEVNPTNKERSAEFVCDGVLEKEKLTTTFPDQDLEIKSSPQAEPLSEDKSSANSLAGEYQNNCQKFEEQFTRRTELLPFEEWTNGRVGSRKQYKADFVEEVRQYLGTTPRYAKELRREASTGEAKAFILNTSRTPEGKETLLARWESFEELRQRKQPVQVVQQQMEVVDELRLAIEKKRQGQPVRVPVRLAK